MTSATTPVVSLTDETIQCCACPKTFLFDVRSQELYKRKDFQNKPKRCPECRKKKRQERRTTGPITPEKTQADTMSDRELLLEACKAVGELRVFVERQFKALDSRLGQLEKDLFED